MEVARLGGAVDQWVPPPSALVAILRFRRLGVAAYETVANVIEDDDAFRLRVATVAEEADVGRAGWLWLHRPEGWMTDSAWVAAGSPGARTDSEGRNGGEHAKLGAAAALGPSASARATKGSTRRASKVDAAVERHRRKAEEADNRRRKAVDQLTEVRRQRDEAQAEAGALTARLVALEGDRNEAVRAMKAVEAQLTRARHERRVARQATREAEVELRSLRAAPAEARVREPPFRSALGTETVPNADQSPPGDAPLWDRQAAAAAMATAAQAAEVIGRSLAAAAAALAPDQGDSQEDALLSELVTNSVPHSDKKAALGARSRPRTRSRRVAPALPPGVFGGSGEANRYLLMSGEALVLVDGYNVARTAWPDLSPEEDRRRLVRVLEGLQARSRGPITVVFDGETGTFAPRASHLVRVAFSATGVTADDDIAARLAGVSVDQPVVVVSSDGAVAADARRQGAVAMNAPDFLAAAGLPR